MVATRVFQKAASADAIVYRYDAQYVICAISENGKPPLETDPARAGDTQSGLAPQQETNYD